jgi:hypothetical protein
MAEILEPSPFMRTPVEIRLMIYDLLLNDNGNKTFSIRSQPPETYKSRGKHRRTGYRILGGVFKRQRLPTTYHLTTNANLHSNILCTSRAIYEEAWHLLYAKRSFDFGEDIDAIVPFLSDLTPTTRSLIEEISLTKQGYLHTQREERMDWRSVCLYLSHNMKLRKLILRVIGGRSSRGWEDLPVYTDISFTTLASVRFEGTEWVEDLTCVKLQELEVIPQIEHIPETTIAPTDFFKAFSASIDKGFTDYLRMKMVLPTSASIQW